MAKDYKAEVEIIKRLCEGCLVAEENDRCSECPFKKRGWCINDDPITAFGDYELLEELFKFFDDVEEDLEERDWYERHVAWQKDYVDECNRGWDECKADMEDRM